MQPWWLSTGLRVFRPAEGNWSFSTPLRRCAWIACAEPFYNKAQTKQYDVVSVTVVNTCRSKEGSTACLDHNCVWVDLSCSVTPWSLHLCTPSIPHGECSPSYCYLVPVNNQILNLCIDWLTSVQAALTPTVFQGQLRRPDRKHKDVGVTSCTSARNAILDRPSRM